MKQICSRLSHGHYEKFSIKRNQYLVKLTPTILTHIFDSTLRQNGLNTSNMRLYIYFLYFLIDLNLKKLKNIIVKYEIKDIFGVDLSASYKIS